MSVLIGTDANRKDCPFPSKLCTECPFYKMVACDDCLRHGKECTDGSFRAKRMCPSYCSWKNDIKPLYEKERKVVASSMPEVVSTRDEIAKRLVREAWKHIGKTPPPLENDENGNEA